MIKFLNFENHFEFLFDFITLNNNLIIKIKSMTLVLTITKMDYLFLNFQFIKILKKEMFMKIFLVKVIFDINYLLTLIITQKLIQLRFPY